MTRARASAILLLGICSATIRADAALQSLLVLCTAEQCEYRLVTSVAIHGQSSVRLASNQFQTVVPSAAGKFPAVRLDQITGLVRDARTGVLYGLNTDLRGSDAAVPMKLEGKAPIAMTALWQGATIQFAVVGSKTKSIAPVQDLAYLVVSTDVEDAISRLLRQLINTTDGDPRRVRLIRGAFQFGGGSPAFPRWRELILNRIGSQLQRFEQQEGDPTTLASALRDAAELRTACPLSALAKENAVLDAVAASSELFARRLAVIDTLRAAGLWDEYLLKMAQLGLARWSVPDSLERTREALSKSTELHVQRSIAFAKDGHYDRSFDEARIAARNSCDPAVLDRYYRTRSTLVDHYQVGSVLEYAGKEKVFLEQTVRSLEQLDPSKEQGTLDRIRGGEAADPDYLPLQWKKAEFLDLLGKYSEALTVLERIERTVHLDHAQLELCLRLDARITNNLLDTIQKSTEDSRRAFDEGSYQDALNAATPGLKGDPTNARLLYYGGMSAAFLRQTKLSVGFMQTYLRDANMTCGSPKEPEQVLGVYRRLTSSTPTIAPAEGIPNWMSGARYGLRIPYDPISLSFAQPVSVIVSKNDEGTTTTTFEREDRSYLVSGIRTSLVPNTGSGNVGSTRTLSTMVPKYDRQSLAMLEVTSGGQPAYRVTFRNSPLVDTDLILAFTGRHVTRGWAGNPFFHPFVWNGVYLFDLVYDDLGRLSSATPVKEDAGSLPDRFSEPLEFTWFQNTNLLVQIRGVRSGYLRNLIYNKDGLLVSEAISLAKGTGEITYTYAPNSAQLIGAECQDNFWDKRDRRVSFGLAQGR